MSASRENEIGRCRCPVCNSTRARLRVSGKNLAYTVCNACNVQVFSRSDRSDELLRALHIAEDAPPAPATEAPEVPNSTQTAPKQHQIATQVAAPPAIEQVKEKKAMSWGMFA